MKKRVGFGITNHYLEASRRSKGERKQFNYSTCTIVQDLALILIVDPDTKHQIKKSQLCPDPKLGQNHPNEDTRAHLVHEISES